MDSQYKLCILLPFFFCNMLLKGQPMEFIHSMVHLSDYSLSDKVKLFTETEFKIEERYGRQKESRRLTCYFDTLGYNTEERQIDSDGSIALRITHDYMYSKPIKDVLYHVSGSVESVKIYIYKPDCIEIKKDGFLKYIIRMSGDQITSVEHYSEGKIENTLRYKYKNSKLETCQLYSGKEKLETTYKYSYDANNKLIEEEEMNASDNSKHVNKYKYNSNGDMVKESSKYFSEPEPITIDYTYIYDERKNWIEKQELMNGRLFAITVREILYYD